MELVTTVSCGMRARWAAAAYVVVPALTAIVALGWTSAAAAAAISSLAAGSRQDLASNHGSSLVPCWGTVAPP